MVILALGAVGLLIFAASCRRIWSTDFWWQFKAGEYVSQHGIPHEDTFSYTRRGQEYIELRWLFCYCLYQIMHIVGPAGVILTQCAMMLAAFGLLIAMPCSRKSVPAAVLAATIGALAASQRFQCRPEQVSYFLLAAFMFLIDTARKGRWRWLIGVPLLQIVWTNSHTMFMLGPLVVGAWFVCSVLDRVLSHPGNDAPHSDRREVRFAALTLVATMAACFANPYGWRGITFTFQLATEIHGTAFKDNISELAGTFSLAQEYTAVLFLKVLFAIVVLSAALNWRRLDRFLLIVCVAMGYLAVTAVRNVPLMSVAAVPFISDNFARTELSMRPFGRVLSRIGRAIACATAIVISIVGVWSNMTDRFHVWQGDTNQFGLALAEHRFPFAGMEFLKAHHLDGPVFNTMMEGGYLLANDVPVFIDSRLEVYGESFFVDFIRMLSDPPFWREAVGKYDFRVLFVDLGFAANALVTGDPNWGLVYFDDVVAIYVRSDSLGSVPVIGRDVPFDESLTRIQKNLPRAEPIASTSLAGRISSPFPAQKMAMFLYNIQQFPLAESFIDQAIRIDPNVAAFHSLRAKVMDQLKRLPEAIASYEEAIRLDPNDPVTRGLLGRRYFSSQQFDKALPLLEAAVAAQPDNAINWSLLTRMYLTNSKLDLALNSARRSVEFDPNNVQCHKDVAKIYAALGEVEPMIPAFLAAAKLAPQDCSIWRDLFTVLQKMGRKDKAQVLFDQVPPACQQSAEVAELMRQLGSL